MNARRLNRTCNKDTHDMMKTGKKMAAIAVVLLTVLAAVYAAYGVLKYQEKISNTVTVTGYEIQLWRADTN